MDVKGKKLSVKWRSLMNQLQSSSQWSNHSGRQDDRDDKNYYCKMRWSGLKWWWDDDNDDDEPITIIVSMEQSPRKSSSGKDWSHFQSNPASQVLLFSTACVEKCKCHSTSSSVTPLFAQHKITLTLWQHLAFLANREPNLYLTFKTGTLNHFLRAGKVCNSVSLSRNLAHKM